VAWRPFSKRDIPELPNWDSPFEEVPAHLLPSLLGVINQQINYYPELMGLVQRKLQLDYRNVQSIDLFMQYLQSPAENTLDVVDLIVEFLWEQVHHGAGFQYQTTSATDFANFVSNVNKYFSESNTNFEINKSGESWGLTRRFGKEVTMTLKDIESAGGSTAELLRTAWDKFTSHDSDYRGSVSYSILALESVVCPMFTPKDSTPTLGKALSVIKSHRNEIGINGIEPKEIKTSEVLVVLIQSLWETQRRHVEIAGQAPKEVTSEEAQSTLILTISIVHLFQRGLVFKDF
jgi:hypothetical protein